MTTDRVSKEKRSWIMSRVRSRDTKPEMKVRSLAHRLGYRFRLHRKDLPGQPDLVFVSKRKVIFVHGCFWHGHGCSRGNRQPQANAEYWSAKIARNRERDPLREHELREMGWKVLVIWECQVKDVEQLKRTLIEFLDDDSAA